MYTVSYTEETHSGQYVAGP